MSNVANINSVRTIDSLPASAKPAAQAQPQGETLRPLGRDSLKTAALTGAATGAAAAVVSLIPATLVALGAASVFGGMGGNAAQHVGSMAKFVTIKNVTTAGISAGVGAGVGALSATTGMNRQAAALTGAAAGGVTGAIVGAATQGHAGWISGAIGGAVGGYFGAKAAGN